MEYIITELDDFTIIKVIGPFNRNAIHSVSKFLKPFLKGNSTKITLDIENLEHEKEIVTKVGLINAFKKEIDQVGGKIRIKAGSKDSSFRTYLAKTRLDRIFGISG